MISFLLFLIQYAVAAIITITTISGDGTGSSAGDGGYASSAYLNKPYGVFSSSPYVYVTEEQGIRVRRIDMSTGIITTFAGTGAAGTGSDNVPATSCTINSPQGIYGDGSTYIYFADKVNHKVRRVHLSSTTITTIAGTGASGNTGNGGQATSATLNFPLGVGYYSPYLYFSQVDNYIKRVDTSSGTIIVLAGTGLAGNTGDNGPATSATLSDPTAFYIDSSYIYFTQSTTGMSCIRRIAKSTNSIYVYAGTGLTSRTGDGGQATAATLDRPFGITTDGTYMYVTERYAHYFRRIDMGTGIITTYCGTGTGIYGGDGGSYTSASFNNPANIYVDTTTMNMWIADNNSNRLRLITPVAAVTATGKLLGDPHFVGLTGGRYSIKGEDNHIYVIFSDTNIHWNIRFVRRSRHGGLYLGETGLRVFDNTIILDPTTWTATVNDQTFVYTNRHQVIVPLDAPEEPTITTNSISRDNTTSSRYYIRIFHSVILIKVPCLRIRFLRALKYTHSRTQRADHFNLLVERILSTECHRPHGLLGLTWDKPAIPTGPDGKGILEGSLKDYEVDHLLSCHYKFSNFRKCANGNKDDLIIN